MGARRREISFAISHRNGCGTRMIAESLNRLNRKGSTPASEDEGRANDEAIKDIKDFVSPDAKPATVKTNGQRLRVRKEPTADSPIAGRVENGDEVTIIETTTDGKWAKISPSGNDNLDGGWVAVEFLVEK